MEDENRCEDIIAIEYARRTIWNNELQLCTDVKDENILLPFSRLVGITHAVAYDRLNI